MSEGGSYFVSTKENLEFVSTGCHLLNCALSGHGKGGWVLGRIANIVGDKSTGKTLLAIEACANFNRDYPEGKIYYREAEAAFDQDYAAALGMPVDDVDFGDSDFYTVEDMFEDLERVLDELEKKGNPPALYIVDSLDALSDRAEQARKLDEGTYGANKPKMLSQMFRRLTQRIEKSRMCVIIISQVRDAIGVTFGDKHTRSGGRALDFYCSQILWLNHMGMLKKTRLGVERVYGVSVRARCKKNKISMPQREAQFEIHFGYGIDDLGASMDWLLEVKRLSVLGIEESKKAAASHLTWVEKMTDDNYFAELDKIGDKVSEVWREIEERFLPTRRKY